MAERVVNPPPAWSGQASTEVKTSVWALHCLSLLWWSGNPLSEREHRTKEEQDQMDLGEFYIKIWHSDYEAFSSAEQRMSIHKVVCVTSQQYPLAFVPVETALTWRQKLCTIQNVVPMIKAVTQGGFCSNTSDIVYSEVVYFCSSSIGRGYIFAAVNWQIVTWTTDQVHQPAISSKILALLKAMH